MKYLVLLGLVLLTAGSLWAVGAVQITDVANINNTGNWMVTANWTGDAANGSVPPATTALTAVQGFNILQVETVPLTPAPTANYTLTVTDARGFDILTGQGSGLLSGTQSQSFQVAGNVAPLLGSLTFNISGQTAAGAKGQVLIWFQKPVTLSASLAHGGGGSGGAGIPSCPAQIQYFRTKPNAGASNVLQCASLPYLNVADYNYPPQTPGPTLTAGMPAAVPVAPCPLGLSGTDMGHYVYVSGGTGTAEAVLITGGSCTSGAKTGTVAFTPANSHSGTWTISSANGGLTEAANANPTGAIMAYTSSITAYAPWIINSGTFTLNGIYPAYTSQGGIYRDASFVNGHIIEVTASGYFKIQNAYVTGSGTSAAYADIACVSGGNLTIQDSMLADGYIGVLVDSCNSATIDHFNYLNGNNTDAKAHAGIKLDCSGTTMLFNVSISNTTLTLYGNPQGTYGLEASCMDGLNIINSGFGGRTGLELDPNGTGGYGGARYIANWTMLGGFIDFPSTVASQQWGIRAVSGGAVNTFGNLAFTGVAINCENSNNANTGVDWGFFQGSSYSTNINFSGMMITGCGSGYTIGTIISSPATAGVSISGGSVWGTSIANSAYGIAIDANNGASSSTTTVTGVKINQASVAIAGLTAITGNITGNTISGNSIGLNLSAGMTGSVVGNGMCGNTTAIALAGTYSGVIADNQCVDDTSPAVASAATLAFPVAPNFTVTGTTGVTAVSGLWASRRGTLITTGGAVAFSLGATIGNACTTVQNKPYLYYFDGTKLWLSGSGC